MDIRRNEFVELTDEVAEKDKDFLIPFDVDEEFELKGYRFKVHRVDINANELILKPLAVPKSEEATHPALNRQQRRALKRRGDNA